MFCDLRLLSSHAGVCGLGFGLHSPWQLLFLADARYMQGSKPSSPENYRPVPKEKDIKTQTTDGFIRVNSVIDDSTKNSSS